MDILQWRDSLHSSCTRPGGYIERDCKVDNCNEGCYHQKSQSLYPNPSL